MNELERRTLTLALNRLGEAGQRDLAELKLDFEDLILDKAAIDATGFSVAETDDILVISLETTGSSAATRRIRLLLLV